MPRTTSRAPTGLLASALASAFALVGGCGEPTPRSGPPHIVFILVDDLGWGDVGYHGSEIATPEIDRLAADGLTLERFYASPMCTPSRAQFLTGRQAIRMGLEVNIHQSDDNGLPPEESTLPELLQEHGYTTAMVGKWHLGHRRPEHHPNRNGFDHFYGLLGGWVNYDTHRQKDRIDWQRNGTTLDEPGYATDLLADEAVRIIEGHDPAAPLFLYAAFNAPHTPLHVAPGRVARDASRRASYVTMVEALDAAIGRVVRALRRAGMFDDTLIFFASDNGAHLKFGGSNGDLRGEKFEAFEGGIRTPAFFHWPGRLPSGASTSQFVSNLDLLPTLLTAAGARHPDPASLDGRDLLAPLEAGRAREHDDLLFAVRSQKRDRTALIRAHWKWVEEEVEAEPGVERGVAENGGERGGENGGENGERRAPDEAEAREDEAAGGAKRRSWLFDIVADEGETVDLSPRRPDLKAELARVAHDRRAGLRDAKRGN